ncbi:hypothetical protein [Ammoniphilus sp. 3BR4]|uniref:hypothetical protein n=1 Tax=Ammoniphilus sp. 3BR4 TaxID=3158265 RepID=UPI003465EE6D
MNQIEMNEHTEGLSKNDPWRYFLMNLLALELLKPHSPRSTWPHIEQMGETMCYFHAGTFTYHNELGELISAPFHLAHTGPIAILVNAQTEEILTDLSFHTDLFMVVEKKLALIMMTRIGQVLLRVHDPALFQLWKGIFPPGHIAAATQFYHQFKKERTSHV